MDFDRHIKILGTGRYIPKRRVEAEDLDDIMHLSKGTSFKATGVQTRYWYQNETTPEMGKYASLQAIERANLRPEDIDIIVSTNGVNAQPVPTGACLLSEQLGLQNTRIPAFDVGSSCMSFLQGLDVVSYMIESGRYDTALICSSDITSVALDFNDVKSAPLLGDGAAAMVVSRDISGESGIYVSHKETFSKGAQFSVIKGGGSLYPPYNYSEETKDNYLYKLQGSKMGKLVFGEVDGFFKRSLENTDMSLRDVVKDVKAIVPHQVSPSFIRLLKAKLRFPTDKVINLTKDYGNMLSASVPLGIDEAIVSGKVTRGDTMLISGGGSGISLGMMYLRY